MAGVDARIVIIGLPQVIQALGADAEQGIWISQAYLLGTIGILLLVGHFADIFGRKRIYTSGFVIFTLGSALTSLAADPFQVIIFRLIQGIGAGIIITSSVTIIVDATPRNELGLSLGINNLGFRLGAMAGLTLSGIIISILGDWRALFYINIPIGIIGTLWSQLAIKETQHIQYNGNKHKLSCIDWTGFTAFTIFVVSLLLALTFAAYGIGSQLLTVECILISIFSLTVFIAQEFRCQNPLLDLKLFRIQEYTGGIVAQLINAISWGAVLLLLSFYFQLVLGLSPIDAGIRIIPFDIAFLIFGPLSGKLSDRFGHLPFTTTGIALSSLSLFLFSTVNATTPYLTTTAYMILFGAAIGIFSSPNMSSVMSAVPAERRGISSALRSTFFNVGFAVSLNLAILVISFTVPYTLVTQIAAGYTTTLNVGKEMFLQGLKTTYLWLAVLNATAIIPSVLRGKGQKTTETNATQTITAEI
jgi:EmrB/QacA subfamily drug resistance transporter